MTNNNGWKTAAIVFILLFVLENAIFVFAVIGADNEQKQISVCYYDVCADYSQADYDTNYKLCNCYDDDLLGNPKLAKQTYMGK